MKGRILGILVLCIWGLIKAPIETAMTKHRESEKLGGYKITAGLREQAGQAGLLAVLGGLRASVADLLYIRAHIAWQNVEYGRVKVYFDICTSLQPRRVLYWDMAAWHMAWNAAAYVENRDKSIDSAMERAREMRRYWKLGEEYLLNGIKNNPDSWEMYEKLGAIYRDKFHDPLKAARAYEEAAKRPGHLEFVRRFAAIYLAQAPGHEQEAYDKLMELYREGEHQWVTSVLIELQNMEDKLNIAADKRIKLTGKYLREVERSRQISRPR